MRSKEEIEGRLEGLRLMHRADSSDSIDLKIKACIQELEWVLWGGTTDEKNCLNCEHYTSPVDEYPCIRCDSFSQWEPNKKYISHDG